MSERLEKIYNWPPTQGQTLFVELFETGKMRGKLQSNKQEAREFTDDKIMIALKNKGVYNTLSQYAEEIKPCFPEHSEDPRKTLLAAAQDFGWQIDPHSDSLILTGVERTYEFALNGSDNSAPTHRLKVLVRWDGVLVPSLQTWAMSANEQGIGLQPSSISFQEQASTSSSGMGFLSSLSKPTEERSLSINLGPLGLKEALVNLDKAERTTGHTGNFLTFLGEEKICLQY